MARGRSYQSQAHERARLFLATLEGTEMTANVEARIVFVGVIGLFGDNASKIPRAGSLYYSRGRSVDLFFRVALVDY